MIYLFHEGEYEGRSVTAVFDVPDGVDVTLVAFLLSLGVSPFPNWDVAAAIINPEYLQHWLNAKRQWCNDKERVLVERGITNVAPAYRQWIEQQPGVRKLPFDEIN